MNDGLKGFSTSFVLHGAILWSLMSMTSLLPAAEVARVIDFSLVERLGVAQKQPVPKTPTIKAPPTLKPAVKSQLAPMISKISVPVQQEELVAEQEEEPLPEEELAAENIIEEVADEPQVTTQPETITAAGPTQSRESFDPSLIKERYITANLGQIKSNIQKRISYPRLARKMGWEGKVIVCFMVDKDGKVQDAHVVESSGYAALDKNAIATIKKAGPFPSTSVRAELVVPVIYRLA